MIFLLLTEVNNIVMSNEIENGVYLDPDTGNIVATGNVHASKVIVPSDESIVVGDKTLKELISADIPLSGYLKLSSDIQQEVNSDMQIDGFVSIGSLSVGSQAAEPFQRLKELMQQKLSRLDPETASTFDIVSALQSIYLGGSI